MQNLKNLKVIIGVSTGAIKANLKRLDSSVQNVLTNKSFVQFKSVYDYTPQEFNSIPDKDSYEAVVTGDTRDVEDILKHFKNIKWVHNLYAGCESILESNTLKGSQNITLTHCKNVSDVPLSEFACTSALYFLRHIPFFENLKRNKEWHARIPLPLLNKRTVAVFGYGAIGKEVGRIFKQGFQCRVIAVDRNTDQVPEYADQVTTTENIKEVVKQADIIVNVLPSTHATQKIFNKDVFDLCRQDTVFVNIGRGMTVNEKDLIDALISGKLLGAGLDVTDPEPINSSSHWYNEKLRDKVLLTLHSMDEQGSGFERRAAIFEENLLRYAKGEDLRYVVDKRAGF